RNFKWIVRREIRPHDRCIAKAVAGSEDIAVRELAELLRKGRRRRIEVGNAVRQISIVCRRSIRQSASRAQHGLWHQLIGDGESRSKCPGVVLVELAMAGAFIVHGTQDAIWS